MKYVIALLVVSCAVLTSARAIEKTQVLNDENKLSSLPENVKFFLFI